MKLLDPVLVGFILFCVNRKGRDWPALYDEMCWVAGRHMYQGLGYNELKGKGLSLGINDIDEIVNAVEVILSTHYNSNLASATATL